jgi:hypothetical protein
MKCLHCEYDSKYRERSHGRCPKCRKQFTFEPRQGDPFTDRAFNSAIQAVSSEGAVRWNKAHLYYELCWRKRAKVPPTIILVACGVVAVFLSGIFSVALETPLALIPGLLMALAMFGIAAYGSSSTVSLDKAQFERLLERWVAAHGQPPAIIARKEWSGQAALPAELAADLDDYSFDRAVICDKPETVDVLLANQFHFENNCASLSSDGYPPGPFATIRKMLKQNPKLMVYAIHDASPSGCDLAYRLATDPDWFAGQVKVIDVGLRPFHAARFQGLLIPVGGTRGANPAAVTEWEGQWLAKYRLELAVVRPEQLIKRLFRAINLKIDTDRYDSEVIYLPPRHPPSRADGGGNGGGNGGADHEDGAVIVVDTDGSDGMADSFG